MNNVKGFLIERDGRSLFVRELQDWALEDENYKVTPLVPIKPADVLPEWSGIVVTQSTDDTAERIQLMNDLFDLQQQEIDQLKHRLESFIEVVEGIVELTEVISQNSIENRSKLFVISQSCKDILKPNE